MYFVSNPTIKKRMGVMGNGKITCKTWKNGEIVDEKIPFANTCDYDGNINYGDAVCAIQRSGRIVYVSCNKENVDGWTH
tara:strand:+ start:133 stop:369 length:237 start_codon:yes stop_codon:yes gene_type:complete